MNTDSGSSDSGVTAPNFGAGRTVDELLLPVIAGSLHERAVPLAAALADAWNLPIRLIHVSSSISSEDPDLQDVLEGMRSWYPSIEASSEHIYGDDPAVAIAQEVRPQTLAVLASDHIDKWRFKNSVAEALVNHAGVPVMLIGPNVTKADVRHGALDGEIVVGLDGSVGAEAALEPAIGLAAAMGQRVWLVTVVPKPSPTDPPSSATPGRYLQEIAERYRSQADIRWEVMQSNDPVEKLESFAERRHARFLVAATSGRTDPSNHSMASIASGLVALAGRPVLVLSTPETPTIGAASD